MPDPARTRENLEELPADLIDGLRAGRPERHKRRGWLYDPDRRYFVTEALIQTFATREGVEGNSEWAATIGLDPDTIAWLIDHPTPGAYR